MTDLHTCSRRRKGFTLIELLVVIAIISILASLLMPSIRSAMDSARAVKTMSNLRSLGTMFHTYSGDNNGYFPWGTDATFSSGQGSWKYQILDYGNLLPVGNDSVLNAPSAPLTCLIKESGDYLASGFSGNQYVLGSRLVTGQAASWAPRHGVLDVRRPSQTMVLLSGGQSDDSQAPMWDRSATTLLYKPTGAGWYNPEEFLPLQYQITTYGGPGFWVRDGVAGCMADGHVETVPSGEMKWGHLNPGNGP